MLQNKGFENSILKIPKNSFAKMLIVNIFYCFLYSFYYNRKYCYDYNKKLAFFINIIYTNNMIHYIKIKNFHSIYSEVTFDLRLDKKVSKSEFFYDSQTGYKVSRCQSVLGENASGKTNLLKAIGFLKHLILNKSNNRLPYLKFANNQESSLLEIGFETNSMYFEYTICFDQMAVLSEVLRYKDYGKKENIKELFSRENIDGKVLLSSKDKDLNNEIKKLPSMPVWRTYVSFAFDFNWNNNKYLKSFHDYFSSQLFTNIHMTGDTNTVIRRGDKNIDIFDFYNSKDNKIWAINLFNRINQPIKDLSILKEFIDEDKVREIKSMINIPDGADFKIKPAQKAIFSYNFGKDFSVEHIYESLGNRKLFDMIPALYAIFNEGKNNVLIYDELDRSFHPELVYFIVSLFNDKEINKNDSQIIFASHCYSIINELSRHKITFVSKDKNTGETEIYKLSDIEGSDDFSNPYQKYMSGGLGSYPVIRE